MFYQFAKIFFAPLIWLFFLPKTVGKKNITEIPGGAVIISNHVSLKDPVLFGLTSGNKQLHFMAKAVLFKHKLLGPLIKALNAFPVNRDGSDIQAVRKAMDIVKQGDICLIFPEGTRETTDEMLPFKKGVAFITMQCKAPVVPACLSRKRVRGRWLVNYGEPINIQELSQQFPKEERLQKITDYLFQRVLELKEEQAKS